jgi:endoglucanase
LIIGEWAVSPVATETAARWRYFDFFVRTAAKYNTSTVLWDNGADFLDRGTHKWRDEVAMEIYRNAVKGIPNALPDSTTDGSATSQSSSAFIYHRKNDTVTNATLPFFFNGNTLSKISLGSRQLAKGKDYTVNGESITFSAAYLKTIITPSSPTGSLGVLTLTFNSTSRPHSRVPPAPYLLRGRTSSSRLPGPEWIDLRRSRRQRLTGRSWSTTGHSISVRCSKDA